MNSDVLTIGVVVGCVNYLFRYLPLRLRAGNARPTRRGPIGVLLDTIGAAGGLQRAGNSPRRPPPAAYTGWLRRAGPGLLENAQHYFAYASKRPNLRCCLENRPMAISLKYQFLSIIHLIYLSQ